MLLQDQLSGIIDSQKEILAKKDTGLERTILKRIQIIDSFATIITGIRRCGKSTLLLQLMKRQNENALYLNFEDSRLAAFENQDFSRLSWEITQRKAKFLLFDEIQLIENWELYVRQKLEEGYHIAITGSNASLLSKELGTKLTGRHLSFELFPFSYNEFTHFLNLEQSESSIENYIHVGGFPEYVKHGIGSILNSLLDDILTRDIAVRFGVRDVSALRQLAVYLISNIGKPVSAKSLVNVFNVKAASTILEHFQYLEHAYLLAFLPMFSYSLKTQIRNPKKVYTIDMGLFTENSIVFSEENGRRLENLIYIHLRTKYNELYYFKEKGECDFIAIHKGSAQEIIQVCYRLTDANKTREYNGIVEALNYFKKLNGFIITWNQKDKLQIENKTIHLVPAWEYLSNDIDTHQKK
jgi:predicted AAA+ superfamily ATPase